MKRVAIIFGLIVLMMFGYSIWSISFADCLCTCTPSPSATVTPTATPIATTDNADIVMDFSGGSPNDLISVSNLTSSTTNASGITATWSLSRIPQQHTNIVDSTAIPLLQPIICGGVTHSNTSGRAMRYNLDLAVANASNPLWEQQTYTFGTNSAGSVSLASMVTFNATGTTEADFLQLNSSFSVTQFNTTFPNPTLNAHSDKGGTTRGFLLPINTGNTYWVTNRKNVSSGLTEVVVQDGTTGAFIGCSRCLQTVGGLNSMVLGDYILPGGGSFKHSFIALGLGAKAGLPLLPGTFVLPPLPSVVAIDNTSNISLDFDGPPSGNANVARSAYSGFAYKIERTSDNGSSWQTIQSDLEVPLIGFARISPYVDSAVSSGTTYAYRITSMLNEWSSVPAYSNSVTLGSAQWSDTIDPATSDTNDGQGDSNRVHSVVLALPAGIATKLRVYVGSVSAYSTNVKIALYDNSGHLAAQPSQALVIPPGYPNSWLEFNIPITAIAAGNYRIAWMALSNGSNVAYHYLNGAGTTDISTATYSTFAQIAFASPYSHVNGSDAAGVFISP